MQCLRGNTEQLSFSKGQAHNGQLVQAIDKLILTLPTELSDLVLVTTEGNFNHRRIVGSLQTTQLILLWGDKAYSRM